MSYIDETLMSDETVVFRTKPHWIIFSTAAGWLFLTLLVFIFGPVYDFGALHISQSLTISDALSILFLIITIISTLIAYIYYQTSEFGITNRRILMKVGFISRASLEILLQRVESIQVNQSVLGRILNYGTLIISGTGGSKDPFPNIPDPLTFRKMAQQQLEEITK